MSDVISLDDARGALEAERADRRASLQAVVARNPNGKLATKANVMLMDIRAHEEFVAECGDEQTAVDFICAKVISGHSVADVATEFGLSLGLVGAMFGKKPEYEAQLASAQRWVAENYVAQMVGIADGVDEDKQAIAKAGLRLRARKDVAAFYSPGKFGDKAGAGVQVAANITIIHESQ